MRLPTFGFTFEWFWMVFDTGFKCKDLYALTHKNHFEFNLVFDESVLVAFPLVDGFSGFPALFSVGRDVVFVGF